MKSLTFVLNICNGYEFRLWKLWYEDCISFWCHVLSFINLRKPYKVYNTIRQAQLIINQFSGYSEWNSIFQDRMVPILFQIHMNEWLSLLCGFAWSTIHFWLYRLYLIIVGHWRSPWDRLTSFAHINLIVYFNITTAKASRKCEKEWHIDALIRWK